MNINGDIDFPGNITLSATGTAEIRNAYIQRVTSIQEETIAALLGLPHVGRLLFNTETGKLRQWTGNAFENVATDTSGVSGQVALMQTAIGPIISTAYAFDPIVASELTNIAPVNPTNVLDVFKAIDTAIGGLRNPVAFTSLTGVTITNPGANQFLKYDVATTHWVNGGISLAEVFDVVASVQEVNYLVGVTSEVQPQLAALNTTVTGHTTSIAALAAAAAPFIAPYTNEAAITVTHGRNQKYSQVIVVDATDTVVPATIKYVDANSLTVTLSAAGTGTIIVS